MSTISVKLNQKQVINIFQIFKKFQVSNNNNYVKYTFKFDGATITIFNTNSMTIQGNNSERVYKQIFNKEYIENKNLNRNKLENSINNFSQTKFNSIGSDEVGVGDFFGGLVVAAAYININDVEWLKSIGVKDSKLLTDEQIIKIFNLIKERVKHVVIIASPDNYNKMFDNYQNAHIIKAVMHNQALTQLTSKINDQYFIVIDEFASQKNYVNYLMKAKKKMIKIDVSLTHAESKYLCVACASIIARKYFLEQIKNLSDELRIKLPLGSSNKNIPIISKKIIDKFGKQKLSKYCKKHFITYNKVTGE